MADTKKAQTKGGDAENTAGDNTALLQQIEALTAENNGLRAEVEELKKLAKAAAKPGKKGAVEVPAGTFTVDGKKYGFKRAKFIIPANKKTGRAEAVSVTATDVLASPDLQAELVALESNGIVEM